MSLGFFVIIIMAILLGFHLVFFKLTQDDTNQFIIYGIFLCYSLCIIFEKNALNFTIPIKQADSAIELLIVISFVLAVKYVSNLFDNTAFRYVSYIIYALAGIMVILSAVLYILDIAFKMFYPCMFSICSAALILYVVFLIIFWYEVPGWYRILLCSMLFMVVCFTMLLLFQILRIPYAYYWAIGFIVYLVVYEVFSILKVIEEIRFFRNISMSISMSKCDPEDISDVNFTSAEYRILSLMGQGYLESKAIASFLGKSPTTIDTQIRSMFKKTNVNSRVELAKKYCQKDN